MQQIYGAEPDTQISTDSDLATISDKLRLVSINHHPPQQPETNSNDFLKSDEELARLLQVLFYFILCH